MNVSLTPELEKMVRDKVDSGLFSSASEVLREALRRWHRDEARERLLAELDEAIASLDRGEGIELTEELWDQIMAQGDELAASGAPLDPIVTGEPLSEAPRQVVISPQALNDSRTIRAHSQEQ